MIGGRINSRSYRTSGSLATRFMAGFHVDKAFIVADGLQFDGGITSYDNERGLLSQAFVKQAKQTIVLADHSKIGANYGCRIAELGEIDIIVSGVAPPPEWQQQLEDKDIHWIVADTAEHNAHAGKIGLDAESSW